MHHPHPAFRHGLCCQQHPALLPAVTPPPPCVPFIPFITPFTYLFFIPQRLAPPCLSQARCSSSQRLRRHALQLNCPKVSEMFLIISPRFICSIPHNFVISRCHTHPQPHVPSLACDFASPLRAHTSCSRARFNHHTLPQTMGRTSPAILLLLCCCGYSSHFLRLLLIN